MADFESVVSNTISVFAELPLNLPDEEWLELAWSEKYIDVPPPNVALDTSGDGPFSFCEQISAACDICQQWHRLSSVSSLDENSNGEDCNLWKILMENGVHYKALLGLLYMGIEQGNTAAASLAQKNVALQMSKLYFNLVLVPGSNAYGIFQAGLLQSAVHCFRLPSKKAVKVLGNEPSQTAKNSRQGGRKKQATQNEGFFDELTGTQASEADDISHENLSDHLSVITDALRDLVLMLQSLSMHSHVELVEFTIQQLCEITQTDIPGSQVAFDHVPNRHKNYSHYKYLMTYAYLALKLLCSARHGDPVGNFTSVAKHLMPHILMLSTGNTATISRPFSNVRDNAVSFLLHVLEGHKENRESWEEVVYILVQHLALQAVDKADFRLKTAQAIVTLMDTLSSNLFEQFTGWIGRLALMQQTNRRVFALELIAALIWNEKVGKRRADLLLMALRRCNDKAAAVKTRALGFLAAVTGGPPSEWMPLLQGTVDAEQSFQQQGKVATDHLMHMMMMLLLRLDDEKVHVRRTALGVLENVLCAGGDLLKEEYVKMLYERCLDPAVLVRKQALQCMTRCLQVHSHCDSLLCRWVEGVLPAVFDTETSVQEKAVEMVECALLTPLIGSSTGGDPQLSWRLLGLLTEDRFCGYHTYLQRAVRTLAHGNKLRPGMLKRLKPHLGGPSDASVWLLLSKLALFSDLGEANFALDYWKQACDGTEQASSETLHNVLLVIRKTAHHLPLEQLEKAIGEFEQQLEAMTLSVEVVPKLVDCLLALSHILCKDDEKWLGVVNSWGTKMLQHCSNYLSPMLRECVRKLEEDFEEQVIAHLVLMGEAAEAAPKAVTEHMQELVEICLSTPLSGNMEKPAPAAIQSTRKRSRRSKSLGPTGPTVTQRIRAHAFVTLGKMCLQNEAFAKKTVAALAKELKNTDDNVIRHNIILIFADLCKRYAVLVDPYLPCIVACLSDRDPDLRHMTLTTLFQLLKQDFIKLRCPLFYHLLSTLVDKNSTIRKLSCYGLGVQVYARHPHVFYQRFIETLYYLNNASKAAKSPDGSAASSLAGEANAEARMTIFRFLLDHMTDEQRFMLNLNITQNVLAPCTDDQDLLMISCPDLLKDALAILCCDEIKLRTITASDESAEEDLGQAMLLAARKNILSHFVKRNVVENVVPVVISLKHRLEAERSPLLRHLLMFLRELMRDYKSEVKEILSIDKNTASEVEFDLKKLEEEEKAMEERAKRRKSTAVAPVTPHTPKTPRNAERALLQALQESARKVKESAKKAKQLAKKCNPDQNKENRSERNGSEDTANRGAHERLTGGDPGKERDDGAGKESRSNERPTAMSPTSREAQECPIDQVEQKKQQTPRNIPLRSGACGNSLGQKDNVTPLTTPRVTALKSGTPERPKGQNNPPDAGPYLTTPSRTSSRTRTPRRRFPLEQIVEEVGSPNRNTPKEKKGGEFKVPQSKKGPDVETSTPSSRMPPPFPSDISAIQ